MAVQKKRDLWYAYVYTGTKDGKEIREYSKGFKKKSDAQLAELEMRKAVIENEHKVINKESLVYVAEKWLGVRKKTVAPTTYRQNSYNYNKYIKPYFSDKIITDIDSMAITEFMLSLDLSPATINKVMNALKQIFDFAITVKYIRSNPCNGIKKPSIRRKKKETWSPQQIKSFLNLLDVKLSTCYTALWLLFSTGMRPGEVCGLRWCDVYEDYIVPIIGIDKNREYTELKNDKAHDPIYLDMQLILHLKKVKLAHIALCKDRDINFSSELFINCFTDDFRPMTPDYLCKVFRKLSIRNDFPVINLYSATRHSFGTNMMKSGINPKMVADMMRHTTVRTTLDNYTHTDEQMYKDTIKMYNSKII